jgi:iron(III) transport system substrate-binding protein
MPRPRPAVAARAAGLAVAGLLTASCGFSAGASEDTLHVYSARTYGVESAFQQFEEETGIDVEFLNGNDAELRERLAAEGEDTEADVFITVDAANLGLAAEQGLFAPVESPGLEEAVPENLRDPQDRWFGLAQRSRALVYNPEAVSPEELSTYAALGEPQWRDRVCMRGSTSSYTQSLVASLIANEGYDRALEIVSSWVDNGVQIINNDVEILETIAAGGCDVGITNHYYLARKLNEDPSFPVAIFWPNQETTGAHVNISGAGVTRHADSPELARRFLEWLATDGQEPLVRGSFEYPVNDAVEPDALLEQFGEFRPDPVNVGELGRFNADALRLMQEAGYA